MTPTPEQIEAEMEVAFKFSREEFPNPDEIALALATARLEGEAAGRNKALDEAAELARDEDGRFTHCGQDRNTRLLQQCAGEIADAILALKGEPT